MPIDHGVNFNNIDSVYLRQKKPKNSLFFYFYKSLQVVLLVWIFTVLVITATPWADFWVKSKIREENQQTLGENTIVSPTAIPDSKDISPNFYLKNNEVEIKAPVVEGIDEESLKRGIGHHPDSVWPNEKGNVVLAGHNIDLDVDNPYGKVFLKLRDVQLEDEVRIFYEANTYVYKVFLRQTVAPDDLSLFGKSDEWLLTFYTCDPPYTDWKRLVLQAKLVKIE